MNHILVYCVHNEVVIERLLETIPQHILFT